MDPLANCKRIEVHIKMITAKTRNFILRLFFKPPKFATRRYQRVFQGVIVFLTFFTLCNLAVLVAAVVKWKQAREAARRPKQHSVCVTVEHVTSCEGFIDESSGVPKCCTEANVVLDHLLAKYSRRRFDEQVWSRLLSRPQCYDEAVKTSPAATLKGIDVEKSRHSDRIVWSDASQLTVLRETDLRHGKLLILHAAFYFVYSQIKVNPTRCLNESAGPVLSSASAIATVCPATVHHYLYRYSRRHNKTRLLTETSETGCDIGPDANEVTVSFGAAFHLHKGDELFVTTSHPKNLVQSFSGNYFGLFRI